MVRRFFIAFYSDLGYPYPVTQKNEKGRPRPKFRPFSIPSQSEGCQARKPFVHLPRLNTVMIREKTIFIKLNQLHFSDQEMFDMAVASFKPSKCPCPKCSAVGRFKEIQPYERDLVSSSDGIRTIQVILILRFLCESCGHSHALLPDVLVPFASYSLRFILFVLRAYLNRSSTVADFCDHWQIAVSTLYRWIHLFRDHYNAWCGILDRILWVSRSSVESVECHPAFPSAFFSRFGFSFLQHNTSPSASVPFYDRRYRQYCT